MKVSVISVFLSVAITDTRSPLSLLSAFIIKENNMFQLELNGKFFPSQFFPITDTLNSIYKLGHQVETIYFFLPVCHSLHILVPWSGFEPGPQQRKSWVLTTGLPGNSQDPILGLCLWSLVLTYDGIFSWESDPGTLPNVKESHAVWACDPDPQALVLLCLWECVVYPARKWTLGGKEQSERMKDDNLKMGKGQERRVWSNFLKLG